jgi:hypothetical protein
MMPAKSRDEIIAQTGLTGDFILVDTNRSPMPGAYHLPYDRAGEVAPSLFPDKAAPIIVYDGG